MTEYAIRPLREDEVPFLLPFLQGLAEHHNAVAASFAGVYPVMPIDDRIEYMKEHVRNDTACLIGLFQPDGTLSGFAMSSIESAYGEIDYLYVREDLRGKGLGRRLLETLLEKLRSQGARIVDLKVINGNPARQFYEKCGFSHRSTVLAMRMDEKEEEGGAS